MSDIENIPKNAGDITGLKREGELSNSLFSSAAQITNLMELIKSFRSVGEVPETAPPGPPVPEGAPNSVRALLAMAPFMGEANRKNIIIASKLMELMHFINTFEHKDDAEVGEPLDNRNMLLAARPYVEPDKKDMVDLLITVMDISEILRKIERVNVNANKL